MVDEVVTCPYCESGKQIVLATAEDILEAVSQIMEMNGLGRDSGWELKDLLEQAADTEEVLRALLAGTISTNGDETNDQPRH